MSEVDQDDDKALFEVFSLCKSIVLNFLDDITSIVLQDLFESGRPKPVTLDETLFSYLKEDAKSKKSKVL